MSDVPRDDHEDQSAGESRLEQRDEEDARDGQTIESASPLTAADREQLGEYGAPPTRVLVGSCRLRALGQTQLSMISIELM
jgi:hypothetical protein